MRMPASSYPWRISRVLKRLLFMVLSLTGLSLLMVSCTEETRRARTTDHILMIDKEVIDYHHQVVRSENEEIGEYTSRHQWKMIQTPTGLRYMIIGQGNGKKITKGDEIRLKFSISLLNGNDVYTSDSLGFKVIYPGVSEEETGLQEALLLMNRGDHAKLIVPSHLAYGLLGDLKKIPAGATLVYDVEVLDPAHGNR
ncbi:MAG: FKBP-type peptidyl-prolyl cis-trans isomerase [Bacteroidota bacterium]|jgi:FKBP-type peptidyl-prolyl cis-trans isomerase FkpA